MSQPTPAAAPADDPVVGPDPWRRVVAAGAASIGLLAVSWLLLNGRRSVPDWEADVFDGVNGLPDVLRFVLWPIMQLGTFPMWAVGGAVAFAVTRRWRPALAAALAIPLARLTSHLVKTTIERGRPPELLDDVELREHGVGGHGYVSGHTTAAFALATVLTAVLPGRWRWVPYPLAALVGLARVFFGVHLPLDVVGGAGLGTLCGLFLLLAFGVVAPGRRQPAGSAGDG